MPRGGKRSGSGAKKGSKHAATISKEQAREALRQIVLTHMRPLVDAQMAHAQGIKYLVVRDKRSGKFLRVGEGRAAKLNAEEELIEVWEKDPSVQAFTDLMNRAIDKPADHVELQVSGAVSLIETRLEGARKRLAAKD